MPPVTQAAFAPELALPPPYQAVRLRESGDAFAHAAALAPQRGAGTLVYVGRFDVAEFAVVLEPAEPLIRARRVFYAGMGALADAIAAAAPPETAIHIKWPDALYVNWGLVGGGRLAWPKDTEEANVPAWLVFGATIRTAWTKRGDPGLTPELTALDEEGFTEVTSKQIVESFARNFMQALDVWQESGFSAAVRPYLERLARESQQGCAIDENGDLMVRPNSGGTGGDTSGGASERQALLPKLEAPAWLDLAYKDPS
jgi:biotin-(acetyl-CoA carboxylase) ligase